MEQRRKFLGREVSSPLWKVNEETLRLRLESLSFFLRSYLVFLGFFLRLEEVGKGREDSFFPDDVFKEEDGKPSSRGDLSPDFYSSEGRCCGVIKDTRCVTR